MSYTAAILKVSGQSGAWMFVAGLPLRYIPAGTGFGAFAQDDNGLDWPLFTVASTVVDELVENFGRGDDFT